MLVLKRIRVRYSLRVPEGKEEAARRAHEVHHGGCPVYRSISGSIRITTELVLRRS